ncbi:MAG TPA: hypothetical protein VHY08_01560 [Bacillota bacterium]|nr:hypothetical protein [Bacillota bacterium]
MLKYQRFILIFLILLFSLSFSLSLTSAEFKTPKFLTPYIPAGFVIDEKYCKSQNVGMFNTTNIVARKVNQLPKPFVSPEFSNFELGYAETTNAAYVQPMWEEAQQNAENESKTQTNPQNTFFEKETIKGGGEIYWYKGVYFNAQGAKGEASQLTSYGAKIIKQLDKGVLTIKISDFVGERDLIRKCFQTK